MFIALALIVPILVLVGVAYSRPDEFRYARSTTVNASSAAVFSHVNDFHHWANWSPWDKIDLSMQRTYEGPAQGVGAKYAWNSTSNKVGQGSMTITEVDPDRSITVALQFVRPFAANNIARFTFESQGNTVVVTWSMEGRNALIAKLFGLFMNMEKLIGADFEKGLLALKQLAEANAGTPQSVAA